MLASIIMVVKNSVGTIEKSIKSVICQTYRSFELIIIDGNSTDGTIELIKKYAENISTFVSENDNGIYDAMNKGIRHAKGDWIFFLGSNDYLYNDNVLEIISSKLISSPDVNLHTFDVMYEDGEIVKSKLNWTMLFRNSVHHQGAFYNKRIFRELTYPVQYKIYGDYFVNLFIYRKHIRHQHYECLFSTCSRAGISGTPKLKNVVELLNIKAFFFSFPIAVILTIPNYFAYLRKRLKNVFLYL